MNKKELIRTNAYYSGWRDGQYALLDLIEKELFEIGKYIEDYTDPRKGISQIEAILDTIKT